MCLFGRLLLPVLVTKQQVKCFLCNGEKDLDIKTLYNAAVMNMNLGYGQQFIAIIAHWCYIVWSVLHTALYYLCTL